MRYIDFVNQFWREGERKSYTVNEISLYFFLCNECNKKRWQMPFPCSTEYIGSQIGLSKQTICNVRNSLAKRGLIDFIKGRRGTKSPQYSLCDLTNDLTNGLANDLANDLTNNKDKDIDKDRECYNTVRPEKEKPVILPIPELRIRLMGDTLWHDKVLVLLSGEGLYIDKPTLLVLLGQFFLMLETNGPEGKELSDCKQHAYNWIRRKLKEGNYGSKQCDIRRGVEINTHSPEDYEGSF